MATKYEKERKKVNAQKKQDIKNNNEIVVAYSDAVKDLVEIKKEMLPDILKERKAKMLTELEMHGKAIAEQDNLVISGKSFPYQEVIDKCFKPIIVFGCKEAQYSPTELYEVLDVFKELCEACRKVEPTFTPTLDLFLSFADMSTYELNKMRVKPDYAVVTNKIDVFICSYISDNSMKRMIDPRTAELLQKADHRKRDRDEIAPVINVQQNTIYTSDDEELVRKSLMDKIKQIQQ